MKMSCSYQYLRSTPKLSLLDRDTPEQFKIDQNDDDGVCVKTPTLPLKIKAQID